MELDKVLDNATPMTLARLLVALASVEVGKEPTRENFKDATVIAHIYGAVRQAGERNCGDDFYQIVDEVQA